MPLPLWTSCEAANPGPRFTLVTPCYNQGQFFEATICTALLLLAPRLPVVLYDLGGQA